MLAVLHTLAGDINKANGKEKRALQAVLRSAGGYVGLLDQDSDAWFKWQSGKQESGLSDADIDALIAERAQAKKDKNYARADEIRVELKNQGITLEDSREGTRWTRD